MVTDVDSPRLGGGSSSLFSSPTHHVVVDAASAIQSIRRSLSRSPSTPPTFRLIPSAAWSPSRPPPTDRRALSPSGVSRSRPPPPPPSSSSSPRVLSVPPSGGRAHRTSIRKIYTTRSVSRSRSSSSGDALRRPLSESKDHGNGASSARARPRRSQHRETRSLSPAEAMMKPPTDVTQPGSMNLTVPTITAATTTTAPDDRSLVRGYYGGAGSTLLAPVTVSPLKRTESVIDLDMIHDGSPLAKRRSLHAPSALAAELDRVDHRSPSPRLLLGGGGDGERPRPTELPPSTRSYHPWLTSTAGPPSSPVIVSTTTPDRASSLRRSTLQQRHHDRPGYGLARPSNSDRRLELADRAPSSRIRPSSHRVSLDGVWPSTLSESPFRSVGPLPSASVHPLAGGHQGGSSLTTRLASNQPHPLSQTVSQSSSASSVVDESPPYRSRGHAPRPRPLPPPIMDFSRSLPIGAMRPVGPKARPRPPPEGTTTSSTEVTYATPPNYRLVKPLPAAFMSTGLISKRNREPNQLPAAAAAAAKRALMPDTPCKRPAMTFQAVPFPTWPGRSGGGGVGGGGGGGGGGRSSSHDYGFPSTPLHSHRPRLSTGGGGGGLGIFGGKFVRRSLPRRSSFLSSDDGDDRPNSPGTETESLNTADFDLPPTPTKPGWSSGKAPRSDSAIVVGAEIDRHSIFAISKSVGGTSASPVGMTREGKSYHFSFPFPPPPPPPGAPPGGGGGDDVCATEFPNRYPVSNAPKLDWSGRLSPRTPQESMLPPDPSGLSISGRDHDDANNGFENERRRNSTSAFLPATPTTVRDHQPLSHQHFPSWTPRTGRGPQDLDATLRRRFGKVELIGTGEFSQVYRVTQTSRPDPSQPPSGSPFSTGSHGSIQAAEHVYAVKRSRRPYLGTRDRARKLQEVEVLKRLGQSDHTVHLIDSWEERDHLYIQTEFCEEGSLDLFLAQVGRKARLDDFRIWKIMLELCLVGLPPLPFILDSPEKKKKKKKDDNVLM